MDFDHEGHTHTYFQQHGVSFYLVHSFFQFGFFFRSRGTTFLFSYCVLCFPVVFLFYWRFLFLRVMFCLYLCASFICSLSIRFIMRHKCVSQRYFHRLFRNRSFLDPLISCSFSLFRAPTLFVPSQLRNSTLLRILVRVCSVSFSIAIQWFLFLSLSPSRDPFSLKFVFYSPAWPIIKQRTNCILLYALQ